MEPRDNPIRNAVGAFLAVAVVAVVAIVAVGVLSSPALVAQQTAVPTAQQTAVPRQVTFTKDIAPILQRSCQNCHRPNGGVAPMALTTYEEVRPWARAVKLRTAKREMPPWFIEKNVGIQKFKDDISLSDEEIATIATWVDSGALQGNPADMPPPRQFAASNAWSIGEPDLIVDSELVTVKAVGGDDFSHDLGSTPTGLTEDRWVAAFEVKEFRPGEIQRSAGRPGESGNNYFSLHHLGIGTAEVGGGADGAATEGRGEGGLQYVYEVGQNAQFIPEGAGVKLKAGGAIYFNGAHLHSIGKEVRLGARIAFKFHPKGWTPNYSYSRYSEGQGFELDIPGNSAVRFDRFVTMDRPARMATFEPHMHASGKRMCAEAIYPTGIVETLNCAGYNHAWVKAYTYQDDVAPLLPKGTILHIMAWYDNTAANPLVVDPRNWRGIGMRSIDDMIILITNFVYYTDEQFNAEVAARAKQRLAQRTNTAPVAHPASSGVTSSSEPPSVSQRPLPPVLEGWAQKTLPTGQNVAPVFEGWEENADGTFNMVFGYFNRNWEEQPNIPIGPNNMLEPGEPDQGQPTLLFPRRNKFVFRVRVPKDFGNKELVWTLTVHGKTERAYGTLKPDYKLDLSVLQENASMRGARDKKEMIDNKPPVVTLEGDARRTVKVGEPLALNARVTDDGLLKPSPAPMRITTDNTALGLRVAWFVYRGPGDQVTFDPGQFKVWQDRKPGGNSPWTPGWAPPPLPADGKFPVKVTFSSPGTYVVRVLAHDGGLDSFKDVAVTVLGASSATASAR